MADLEKANNTNVEIELDDETRTAAITGYIRTAFSSGSGEVFVATLEKTNNLQEAAYDALLNEALISAIADHLKENGKLDDDYELSQK